MVSNKRVMLLYIYLGETNYFSFFSDQIEQISYYPISVYFKRNKKNII